jgi:hypothetical protein
MNTLARIYISFSRSGKVNHASFFRANRRKDFYPISEVQSERIYEIIRSKRVALYSIQDSAVSGLAEGRWDILPAPAVHDDVVTYMLNHTRDYLTGDVDSAANKLVAAFFPYLSTHEAIELVNNFRARERRVTWKEFYEAI